MSGEVERDTHPSYGVLRISRASGGHGKLFCSPLKHTHRIVLAVCRATRDRHLHHDWVHAGEEVVEFEMSQAQFAQAITSIGLGDGVPCTLTGVAGGSVPACPGDGGTRERIDREFACDMKKASARLDAGIRKAESLLGKKSLTRGDREALLAVLYAARRTFEDQASFAHSSFAEATDKTAASAKAEVEAFVLNLSRQLGVGCPEGPAGAGGPRPLELALIDLDSA